MKGKSLWKPRSTSPKGRANSWSILGKLWTHIQKFKNKFNIFALYHFFFNSLPPSPSYLILFSLFAFSLYPVLLDSYPRFQHSFSISPPLSLFWFLFLFPQPLCCQQVSYIFFRICLFSLSYLLLIPFSIASLWCHHAVISIIFSLAISLSFSHLQQPNSIYSHFQLHLIDAIHIYPCICLSDNYQTEKFLPQFTQSFSCRTLSSCTSLTFIKRFISSLSDWRKNMP